jgi:hypothetical protein
MLRVTRWTTGTGARFCDSCGDVTTAEQRARRYLDRVRARAQAWTGPR